MINKVEITNINTSQLPKLNAAQNKELFLKMKQGDILAREKLINRKFKTSFKYCSKI